MGPEGAGVPAWVVWLFGALCTIAAAAYGAAQWWFARRDSKAAARSKENSTRQAKMERAEREHDEWVIAQSKGLVSDLREQVEQLEGRINEIQREHLECRVALATMTERVQRLESEMTRLRGGAA
jgi:TolA-binding protein